MLHIMQYGLHTKMLPSATAREIRCLAAHLLTADSVKQDEMSMPTKPGQNYLQVLELGWRPEIPDHLPEAYKSFVRQCWEEDREKVSANPDASSLPP